jgi:hypothetical protein
VQPGGGPYAAVTVVPLTVTALQVPAVSFARAATACAFCSAVIVGSIVGSKLNR